MRHVRFLFNTSRLFVGASRVLQAVAQDNLFGKANKLVNKLVYV